MKPSAKKQPSSTGKKAARAKKSTLSTGSAPPQRVPAGASDSMTKSRPRVPYDEPLPFIPYRPVPVSDARRRLTAAEAYSPDRARLEEVLELATSAAGALREVAGPDYNTDVGIRARLNSLATHLQEVARYLTHRYRS